MKIFEEDSMGFSLFRSKWMLAALLVGRSGNLWAANVELKLRVWEGYFPEEVAKKFQKLYKEKTGNDVTFKVDLASDNKEFYDCLRNDTCDIVTPSHNVAKSEKFDFIKKGMLQP